MGNNKDFFGSPRIYDRGTRFNLAPQKRGLSMIQANTSALRNAYFDPGGRSKMFRAGDGRRLAASALTMQPQSEPLSMSPEEFGGFGKPDLDAVGTIGFMSNHTVPGNMTVMYTPDAADEVPGMQDIAILRVSSPNIPQRWGMAGSMLNDETPRETYNLAAFNRMLAVRQRESEDLASLLPPDDPSAVDWNDPISILSEFYVYGIVNDSETGDNRVATPRLRHNSSNSGNEMRRAGVTISGRDQCYNVWGPKTPAGSRLFFILRPTKRPNAYVTNTYNVNARQVRTITEKQAAHLKEYPFQLIPYATMAAVPPDSELLYTNELGAVCRAPFILFGTCYKKDEGGGERNREAISRDIGLVRRQGLIDVVVTV